VKELLEQLWNAPAEDFVVVALLVGGVFWKVFRTLFKDDEKPNRRLRL